MNTKSDNLAQYQDVNLIMISDSEIDAVSHSMNSTSKITDSAKSSKKNLSKFLS